MAATDLRFVTLSAALGGLLFGYDTAVISGAIGNLTEYFSLSAAQTGWAISSALVGCLIGAFVSDFCSDRLGRKKSMLIAALLFLACSIGTAVPETFSMFVIFRIIGGIGVGIASMVVPMYIAEIAPADKRGELVAYNQLAIVIGIVVVYFVNYFIAVQGDAAWNLNMGWRLMFASEAIPSVLYLVLVLFIPESPRWLLQKGREAESIAVLEKFNNKENVAYLVADISSSLHVSSEKPWKALLEPQLRLALVVGIGLSIFQQVTGINAILYYAPEIFKSFGSDVNASLLETSLLGLVNLVFTIISIRLVDKIGRKPLLNIGSVGMLVSLIVVGYSLQHQIAGSWLLGFLMLFMASFSISWGPVVWVLLAEIFPNRIRSLALSISVFIQWGANFAVSQSFPMLVQDKVLQERFHGGFPFVIFAGFAMMALVFVWKLVPETKKMTLEEMDAMWEKRKLK
ncbi:sugar porter family MFS transporter [Flavobacterium sp. MAH-1]|uniref:Sugar porter family MFS transporter n=1 Tax=Flavobacterium agri TaxID=2743471 RepID=A0A7Y8Y271_9FLAO|nr:sugar porter family MFS transporter [Flavobacterium agri]NUY81023.1 sugar porter family MFS transporter [Flavobacterium agri]NYA71047.1 sugar porter family MFS transporter [Flavobacterium agri]